MRPRRIGRWELLAMPSGFDPDTAARVLVSAFD